MSRVVAPEWLIAVAFTVGVALLGAALGIVPDLVEAGWSASPRRSTILSWFGVGAVVVLAVGVLLWWQRNRVLRRRGTAYLVKETGPDWTFEDNQAFLAAVQARFAAVMHVPGPTDLGDLWTWPLDERADQWDQRLDQLVRYFWANHFNDHKDTPNALYIWAPWSVSMAFATRSMTGRRGVDFTVRQRPSYGRSGSIGAAPFSDEGHTFRRPPGRPYPLLSTGAISHHEHHVTLRIQPAAPGPASPAQILILLLRMSKNSFGPVPASDGQGPDDRYVLDVRDAAGLGLSEAATATIHEWRYLPTSGATVAWSDYPTLVADAAGWICQEASAHPDATVLLGAVGPQEFATGLGIHATQRPDWPAALWPLVYGGTFTVPKLNLGRPKGP